MPWGFGACDPGCDDVCDILLLPDDFISVIECNAANGWPKKLIGNLCSNISVKSLGDELCGYSKILLLFVKFSGDCDSTPLSLFGLL